MEAAHPLCPRILAVGLQNRASADDVVDDDHPARPRKLERVREVLGRPLLVGVDEDQVERPGALVDQGAHALERATDADRDDVCEPRALDVGGRQLGVVGVELERDQAPPGGSARASQIVL